MKIEAGDLVKGLNNISIHVSQLLYVKLDSSWRSDFARAGYSRIYYVCKGEGDIICNGKHYRLTPGNIYFIPAGAQFAYSCQKTVEKLYVHVNILRDNRFDLFSQLRDCVVLTNRQEDIDRALAHRSGDIHDMLWLKSHLYTLMLEVLERSGADLGRMESHTELTERALSYVENNLRNGLRAGTIADALQVPESRLQRVFRQDMKIPLGRYIAQRVMSVAERQLRLTDDSVKAIGERFGFCDQFYFSRRFAEQFGISPGQYRKQINIGQPVKVVEKK